jgi:serine protein kinase
MSDLSWLREIEERTGQSFAERRQVLSLDEYFALFMADPRAQLRTAPQYLRDCIAHYGTVEVERPGVRATRFRIFDAPWQDGKDRVVGQEDVQQAVFRLLHNFIRERRVTRLVMLHGPNGSAKSSFVECLAMGLEDYSAQPEGAVYRFNWVFPASKVSKKRLGFGDEARSSGLAPGSSARAGLQSFAYLEDDDVDARLPADLRDHPLLLLPRDERRRLVESTLARLGEGEQAEPIADYLLDGDLSPRSRAIFDALLNAYHGDLQRVFQHIQVVRFTYARRYRQGIVTIEPQLHVDAQIRQVTMDQGLGNLPPALRNLSLFEPAGDLVDANRGLIHHNDLLKRPIDAFKYLLATCEKGTVALPSAILHLDLVMFATSNEGHLRAFKEYPDFASFKGRMDLVRMPYLLDWVTEQRIYDAHLKAAGLSDRVAPHATHVLATWAVLTRLRRPRPELHDPRVRDVATRLTPLEKADLYAQGRVPRDATAEQGRELLAALPALLHEAADSPEAEGLSGASPREMKQVLLNALQDPRHPGLTPLGILDELRDLVRQRSVYEYLQQKRDGGYHDHEGFIEQVHQRWLEIVDGELRQAMGLVAEHRYEDLFARYLLHVSYLHKNEKIWNEKTKSYEAPDTGLMAELERVWGVSGDTERFRRDLVSRVGAWRVEHPGAALPWRELFPKLITQLEEDYYARQKVRVERQLTHCLAVLSADRAGTAGVVDGLAAADVVRAREVISVFETTLGYPRDALGETLVALRKSRY